jgi:hypothetical protein
VSEQRDRPQMRLLRWRKIAKGYVAGAADIELPNGLQIIDVLIIAKEGKLWANLPSKVRVGSDGHMVRGANRKPIYETVVKWNSRSLREAFSKRVVALIAAQHSQDLPGVAKAVGC